MRKSYLFFDNTQYLPFAFKERQLHSVLCPALFDLTGTSLMEVPLERKQLLGSRRSGRVKRRKGWVDYTCCYGRPRVDFFIEVKHGWNCCSNAIVRAEINKKWLSSIRQLRSVKGQVKGWLSNKGAIRLALLFVFHYTQKEMAFSLEEILRQHQMIHDALSRNKPHWHALFHVKKKYRGPFEYEKSTEFHPAMSVYAFAYKIQRN